MDPTRLPPALSQFAPDSQPACHSPWLKVRVLIRAALTHPWTPEAWPEIREHLNWLLSEESRLRRQGWRD